jgi:L-ascorbate metabolism protein UlaG (beta-lactamase superfamily)
MTWAVVLAACGLKLPGGHPSLSPYRAYQQQPSSGLITAVFLGTTSVLFRDEKTAILTDPFVTRPDLVDVGLRRPIEPNVTRIRETIEYLGIGHIDAIVAGHSHYDHVMDAPEFARLTGAELLGSTSTENVGLGWPTLPPGQIKPVKDGETRRYGEFELTFVASQHSRDERYSGAIESKLTPPQPVDHWKTGDVWSVFIRHGKRTILFHGSANLTLSPFLPTQQADVVYLGIGGLGKQDDSFVEEYWLKVVRATGARRVVLVHWDDFFRGLEKPLRPLPYPGDWLPDTMRRLLQCAATDGVDVVLPVPWQTTDPFAGLSAEPTPARLAPHPCQSPIRN